jgi:hypothetical protein
MIRGRQYRNTCVQLRSGTCQNEEMVDTCMRPVTKYACIYWIEHLRKSSSSSSRIDIPAKASSVLRAAVQVCA